MLNYKVSVVIPVYNCEKFIKRAVESVISQPDSERYQIILVDDGSTDNSWTVCDELQKKYSNVNAFRQENAGVSAARNAGIEHAEGEWISFIDSDDYLHNGFFEKLLAEPSADLLCCDFDIKDKSFPLIGERIDEGVYYKKDFHKILYPLMAESTVFYSACNKIFKTEIIIKNNVRFIVGMKYAEDMTFVYEYVKYIESFKFVNEKLYYYFGNENGATSVIKKSYEIYKLIFCYLNNYFKELNADEDLLKKIQTNFLYNSMGSVFTAINNLKFFEAYSYVKSIVNDSVFYEKYRKNRIYSYSNGGLYLRLDPYIYNRNTFMIFILIKLCNLKVKLYEIKNRSNGNG